MYTYNFRNLTPYLVLACALYMHWSALFYIFVQGSSLLFRFVQCIRANDEYLETMNYVLSLFSLPVLAIHIISDNYILKLFFEIIPFIQHVMVWRQHCAKSCQQVKAQSLSKGTLQYIKEDSKVQSCSLWKKTGQVLGTYFPGGSNLAWGLGKAFWKRS